jgi:hypothetical protein
MADSQSSAYSGKTDQTYFKGQCILYKGAEAMILDVHPVLTIKIQGKNKIICGNAILNDVGPGDNRDFNILPFHNR